MPLLLRPWPVDTKEAEMLPRKQMGGVEPATHSQGVRGGAAGGLWEGPHPLFTELDKNPLPEQGGTDTGL